MCLRSRQSHVVLKLCIPVASSSRPGPCIPVARHCEREVLLAYITLDVRGLVLPASEQGWHGGSQSAFHRLVVSTHSLELKTSRSQTSQSIQLKCLF